MSVIEEHNDPVVSLFRLAIATGSDMQSNHKASQWAEIMQRESHRYKEELLKVLGPTAQDEALNKSMERNKKLLEGQKQLASVLRRILDQIATNTNSVELTALMDEGEKLLTGSPYETKTPVPARMVDPHVKS